jgi:hypothetical protein
MDHDPELNPDQHSSKWLDLDPHIMYANPKHCFCYLTFFSNLPGFGAIFSNLRDVASFGLDRGFF